MRHRVKTKKIGKDLAHRKSILRNLTKALIYKERVTTTVGKVKIFRSFVEKIITRSKNDTLHNRRMVYRDVRDTRLLKKLFENIGKRYVGRNGGYTRIYKLNQRTGDGSEMCILELVEEKIDEGSEKTVENNKEKNTGEGKKATKETEKKESKDEKPSKEKSKKEGLKKNKVEEKVKDKPERSREEPSKEETSSLTSEEVKKDNEQNQS